MKWPQRRRVQRDRLFEDFGELWLGIGLVLRPGRTDQGGA